MTDPMSEKIEEEVRRIAEFYCHGVNLSTLDGIRRGILYGRTSALDEVEKGLPEAKSDYVFDLQEGLNLEQKTGFNFYREKAKQLISRIRSETSG